MRAMHYRRAIPGLVLLTGLLLLVVTWVATNPVGAFPDEPGNYVKALGVGSGQWLGRVPAAAEFDRLTDPAMFTSLPIQIEMNREVDIPATLQPGNAGCTAFTALPGSCTAADSNLHGIGTQAYTETGTYQPFVYLPSGLAMLQTSDPFQAFVVGRLVLGLISVALWFSGFYLLLAMNLRPNYLLLGFCAATTPMVLFVFSALSASSIEISGAWASCCAVLHLAYRGPRSTSALVLLAIAGSLLALSRPIGPLWVIAGIAIALWGLGPKAVYRFIEQHRLTCLMTATALALSCAAGLTWQMVVQPHPSLSIATVTSGVSGGFTLLQTVVPQEIGTFGWMNVFQVAPAYWFWIVLFVALVSVSLLRATHTERNILILMLIIDVLLVPALNGFFSASIGAPGGVQGRWILPFTVCIPALASTILARRPSKSAIEHGSILAALFLFCAFQLVAIAANSHRYAAEPDGPAAFFVSPEWSPAGGWILWMVLAICGCAMIAIAGWLLMRPHGAAELESAVPCTV